MRSHTSRSRAWFLRIQDSNAASVRKVLIFRDSGTTEAMFEDHPWGIDPAESRAPFNRNREALSRPERVRYRRNLPGQSCDDLPPPPPVAAVSAMSEQPQ